MAVGDPYITRDQLKAVLGITSIEEDDWIDRCVLAASRSIERRAGWPTFWQTENAEARWVDTAGQIVPTRGRYPSYKLLLREGIAAADDFAVSGYSTAALGPEGALLEGKPYNSIRLPYGATFGASGQIQVTAVWGWPSVPPDIIWASQMQAQRFYSRKGSPEGTAGSAEWGLSRIPRLDPDVLAILKDGGYMRAGIA